MMRSHSGGRLDFFLGFSGSLLMTQSLSGGTPTVIKSLHEGVRG